MNVFNVRSSGVITAGKLLPAMTILLAFAMFLTYLFLESAVSRPLIALVLIGFIVLFLIYLGHYFNNSDQTGRGDADAGLKRQIAELKIQQDALKNELAEMKQAGETAEKEILRLTSVLDLLPAYIILLTPDHHVSYANRFFKERFGESGGRKCFEYLFNRTEPCEVCDTYRVLNENQPITWEWTGPDNHNYSIFDFPFADSDGSPMIMEAGIDVTDLKVAQEELISLNSRLEERVASRTIELSRSNERLRILSETSASLLESDNPQALIDDLCSKIMNFLGCDVFFNYLLDDEKGKLNLNSYGGISQETARGIKWLDMGVAVCGCVARDGKRIIAENIPGNKDKLTSLVSSFGVKAYACHPLMSGDKVLGTLSFGTKSRLTFTGDEISLMKTVADEVAIAISRVRYENALRDSEIRFRTAAESLSKLNRSLISLGKSSKVMMHASDEQHYIDQICRILVEDCGHKMVWIGYAQDDAEKNVVPVAHFGFEEGYIQTLRITWSDTERGRGPSGTAIRTGEVAKCTNMQTDPAFEPWREEAIKRGYQSSIVFPLMNSGRAFGVICIYSKDQDPFTEEETSLLSELANDLSYGIRYIRLLKSEKSALAAIRESEEKLNLALHNGNIGTWELNPVTGLMVWDSRMENIFGFEKGTFSGTINAFESCIADDDIPYVRKAISDAITLELPFETVYRIKKKGCMNYISSKASVTRSKGEKQVRISGVCFDITDMKQGAERALFRLNENLMRSNRELEQFARVASHDLQEPLRLISSYTQMLERKYGSRLDEDAHEYIKYAVSGAAHMQNIINDLLEFSKIETKAEDFTAVDMNTAFKQAMNNIKAGINDKKAKITAGELPVVTAEYNQMVQLFMQLVDNSVKFCDRVPEIHISAEIKEHNHIFTVADNGIGIEPQYFERIFMVFQRLMHRDRYEGTGIGLAICKRIIERHGGKIWLESEQGCGSKFFFSIPE